MNPVVQIQKEKKHQQKLHPSWNHHLEDGIMYPILGKIPAIITHLLENTLKYVCARARVCKIKINIMSYKRF